MYAIPGRTDAGIDEPPATQRFDPRRHRRITGLFDLWLEPGIHGGLVVPHRPDRPLTASAITDLVRRSGETANDVRILTQDGARHTELFSEVAGLLAHDVLVSPDNAVIRHHDQQIGAGPLHAVPLDRTTRQVQDWIVIQPPELATPLPGWFTVDHGLVRPRTGVVGLPLHGGVVLATRADFVTRRATAHRLGAASDGLVTIAVTARSGGFLVGDYGGTQRVYDGGQLAALLGDLPLYGSELRLWLTWPSDPDEQQRLGAQAQELAETTGATVWTPPPGGSAELVDGRQDLRALDHAGKPVEWQAFRPRFALGPPALRATSTGLLVPVSAELVTTTAPSQPPPETDSPEADQLPAALAALPLPRPALVTESRRTAYGPPWLSAAQQVNAEKFEALVALPVEGRSVADGIPSAELFLLAFLDPKSVPEGSRLLRVRVEPGGAIPMGVLRASLPARLQHLRGLREAYLLPAARLDRAFAVDTFDVDRTGRLTPAGECTGEGEPLRIRCTSRARSIGGLPNEVRRWPAFGTRRAYALLPAKRLRLPRNWLRLYRRRPPVQPGRVLLEIQVPRGRAIDVTSTADLVAPLGQVRSQAQPLRDAQVELIVGSRSYPRVRVRRAYRAESDAWVRVPRLPKGPLPDVVPRLQPPEPS
ncbi:hypothetical protein SAMN05443287_103637 [Micromonospora phaseoli]|uniref:Uncharacterized protein n=1 Tax=Micromonospora phaseoli TaxID=1144548 RepID=A0A1H6XUF4_9ACTN|nr:hypothetical protein [Micromonospora phaseoli]PZW02261.1 hypothetical protein CLV64_102635 [Micromonospora phaseoli]GIJ75736.1 hypothetical protein Xph01_01680 [Micromonospora phaseoli]SEJ28500.1 hypothetical protein SAMN05443287_103637 [Micromonospora phaseoli]